MGITIEEFQKMRLEKFKASIVLDVIIIVLTTVVWDMINKVNPQLFVGKELVSLMALIVIALIAISMVEKRYKDVRTEYDEKNRTRLSNSLIVAAIVFCIIGFTGILQKIPENFIADYLGNHIVALLAIFDLLINLYCLNRAKANPISELPKAK